MLCWCLQYALFVYASFVLDAQLEESQDPFSPIGKRKREETPMTRWKKEAEEVDDAMEAEEVDDAGTPKAHALAAVPVVGKTTTHADPGGRQRHHQEEDLPVCFDNVFCPAQGDPTH